MTNLMCRGRKRGLAGVIATQRLAKLAKNVAAEASNFLMGRTFLDIDMARAADLLGMERRQAEAIRDLERGHFLALGPALSRRPVAIRIGDVRTQARSSSPRLMPMPQPASGDAQMLLFAQDPAPAARERPRPAPPPAAELLAAVAQAPPAAADAGPAASEVDEQRVAGIVDDALREMIGEAEQAYQPVATLYHDFTLRCRMRRLPGPMPDLAQFKRWLAMARAGIFAADLCDSPLAGAVTIAEGLSEDLMAVFLLIARAAHQGQECPSDEDIAHIYGTRSPSRARRLLAYMEEKGVIVVREDLSGKRSIGLPDLGWTTAPAVR
jgi:hypothetical protein